MISSGNLLWKKNIAFVHEANATNLKNKKNADSYMLQVGLRNDGNRISPLPIM
jgi:hypothetical protein